MPSDRGAFAHLFKHEFQIRSRSSVSWKWQWLYFAAFVIVVIAVIAIWGGNDQFKPAYLLYFCFAFPYIFFGVAFGFVKLEWSKSTWGWWLTLPYSRSKLLGAKAAAAAAHSGLLTLFFFVGLMLLELFNQVIHGFDAAAFRSFVLLETQYLVVVAAIAPFMLLFGLFAAVLSQSRYRALTPIAWILFFTLGNVFNLLNVSPKDNAEIHSVLLFDSSSPWWKLAVFPASWLIAVLLFAAAVRMCKKKLIV